MDFLNFPKSVNIFLGKTFSIHKNLKILCNIINKIFLVKITLLHSNSFSSYLKFNYSLLSLKLGDSSDTKSGLEFLIIDIDNISTFKLIFIMFIGFILKVGHIRADFECTFLVGGINFKTILELGIGFSGKINMNTVIRIFTAL